MSYEAIALYSQLLASIIFLLALLWVWVKLIQPAVLAAQENANRQIAQAERHRDEARARLDALQGEIERAKGDAQAILARAAQQAQLERERTLAEAREAGERALRNAQGELARARVRARAQLRDELLERALELAREQAAGRIDASANARLVDGFVRALERGDG